MKRAHSEYPSGVVLCGTRPVHRLDSRWQSLRSEVRGLAQDAHSRAHAAIKMMGAHATVLTLCGPSATQVKKRLRTVSGVVKRELATAGSKLNVRGAKGGQDAERSLDSSTVAAAECLPQRRRGRRNRSTIGDKAQTLSAFTGPDAGFAVWCVPSSLSTARTRQQRVEPKQSSSQQQPSFMDVEGDEALRSQGGEIVAGRQVVPKYASSRVKRRLKNERYRPRCAAPMDVGDGCVGFAATHERDSWRSSSICRH